MPGYPGASRPTYQAGAREAAQPFSPQGRRQERERGWSELAQGVGGVIDRWTKTQDIAGRRERARPISVSDAMAWKPVLMEGFAAQQPTWSSELRANAADAVLRHATKGDLEAWNDVKDWLQGQREMKRRGKEDEFDALKLINTQERLVTNRFEMEVKSGRLDAEDMPSGNALRALAVGEVARANPGRLRGVDAINSIAATLSPAQFATFVERTMKSEPARQQFRRLDSYADGYLSGLQSHVVHEKGFGVWMRHWWAPSRPGQLVIPETRGRAPAAPRPIEPGKEPQVAPRRPGSDRGGVVG